ncbi:hypothetical protein FKW77_010123 [Venturia effusa]|uniref:DUF676 domain-containing protein n=1 Tax=Venturia effusa TaxID=50376 RepID=A0A517KXJ1_9PEZI|nr:hypothetical protein FKW77_010123 [Venturia effusa]
MEALTKHLSGTQAANPEPEPEPVIRTVTFAEDDEKVPKKAKTATFDDTVAPPLNRRVTYIPSQVGAPNDSAVSYTANPLSLLWYDIKLCISKLPASLGIILPLRFGSDADPFDELYPNPHNIMSLLLHGFLMWTQGWFLISLPFCLFTPIWWFIFWVALNLIFNSIIAYLLNGNKIKVYPSVEVDREGKFSDEYWIFLNGVSVGQYWLQSNVDRLSLTFGRPVTGVHNPTDGIIYDLIQCLVQRNFAYNTEDVREAYVCVKEALQDSRIKKVVFILHSQGGIEGGLILDWLFAEVSRTALEHLEVYTFGNAANHFNNPDWTAPSTEIAPIAVDKKPPPTKKVIKHMEHYANSGDFVAQFGVLNYTRVPNRFIGRLFLSPESGHLLNQHYLNYMFPLDESRHRVDDESAFMGMDVRLNRHDVGRDDLMNIEAGDDEDSIAFIGDVNKAVVAPALVRLKKSGKGERLKVRDFSRLWQYRNGGTPDDDVD